MKPDDKPAIQLSYLELGRLSGYEIPKRPCFIIYNRRTQELAKVVSSGAMIAFEWLKWLPRDCDCERVDDIQAVFGIKYCLKVRFPKNFNNYVDHD